MLSQTSIEKLLHILAQRIGDTGCTPRGECYQDLPLAVAVLSRRSYRSGR